MFRREPEAGFERIALFASAGVPTHAARQLPSGRWTSKLGLREDIEHDLQAVSGEVYGTVELPLLLLPLSAAERRKRVDIALDAVGLTDRADHYPRQLSGGEEQRVRIARAIVADKPVTPADLTATILHHLGIDYTREYEAEFQHLRNRLSDGQAVRDRG